MNELPKGLQDVVDYFSRLPGIGKKSASKLAFSLLQKTEDYQQGFGNALSVMHRSIGECQECFHLCEQGKNVCSICESHNREEHTLCIVETSLDLLATERSGSYTGKYFVLGGVISPMDGIGPDQIRTKQLMEHVEKKQYTEIIFALSATMEGESTTLYVADLVQKKNTEIEISRIARGVSLGSSIQYTDENTLQRAFTGRASV